MEQPSPVLDDERRSGRGNPSGDFGATDVPNVYSWICLVGALTQLDVGGDEGRRLGFGTGEVNAVVHGMIDLDGQGGGLHDKLGRSS